MSGSSDSTPSNVVDVDFRAPRTMAEEISRIRHDLDEAAGTADEIVSTIAATTESVRREITSIRTQIRWEQWCLEQDVRRRNAEIRRLRDEVRTLFPSDAAILAALVDAHREVGEPVQAVAVARRVIASPLHVSVIRVGLALSRLATDGKVQQIRPADRRLTHRWAPMEVEGDA